MATKRYIDTNTLLEHTLKQIESSIDEWHAFLTFASIHYKYSFQDILLIYAQRPNATAVTDMRTWNNVFNRRVMRGVRSIAVFDRESANGLKYLFDISDTHGIAPPTHWQLEEEHLTAVKQALTDISENTSANLDNQSLSHIIEMQIQDACTAYITNIEFDLEDSLLGVTDIEIITTQFNAFVLKSSGHIINARTGLDIDEYVDDTFGLSTLSAFNTIKLKSRLFTAMNEISKSVLSTIEQKVKQQTKEILVNERSEQNESDVLRKEQNIESQLRSDELLANDPFREVWQDGTTSPTKNSTLSRDRTGDERHADGNHVSSGRGSKGDGPDAGSTAVKTISNPAPTRYLASDQAKERDQTPSRRNGDESIDTDTEVVTPSSVVPFKGADHTAPFLVQKNLLQDSHSRARDEQDIELVLLRGSGVSGGKQRIVDYFAKSTSNKERATFLKNEYGIGGWTTDFDDNRSGYVSYDGKGLEIRLNGIRGDERIKLSWSKTAKQIDTFIENGKYFKKRYEQDTPPIRPQTTQSQLSFDKNTDLNEYGYTYDKMSQVTQALALELYEQGTELYLLFSDNTESLVEDKDSLLSHIKDGGLVGTEAITDSNQEVQAEIDVKTPTDYSNDTLLLPPTRLKDKFLLNINAIETLKTIEFEKRLATPQEQAVLAKYVGWGGLPDVFNSNKANWTGEYQKLHALLTTDEYEAARASTLNAHYTLPKIIKAMYSALVNFGFTGGNILEPALGTGHFFAEMPQAMRDHSRLTGVELDHLTGRIAKQLYQSADIQVTGFEKTQFANNSFDVVISNVPFGSYQVNDAAYDKHHFLIHDYFIAKSINQVRPGGIVAVITTKGTMDKANSNAREYFTQRADLIGAIRLPNTAFKQMAGTEVTTDILFLQKRESLTHTLPSWINVEKYNQDININSYFIDHPDMILGEMKSVSGPYGMESACIPYPDHDLEILLQTAVLKLSTEISPYLDDVTIQDNELTLPADPNVKNFSFCMVDDDLYYRENTVMFKRELSTANEERVKDMIKLRTSVRSIIDIQTNLGNDAAFEAARKMLNSVYDAFTDKHGYLNSRAVRLACTDDADFPLLSSLEIIDDNGSISKADMFFKRTIKPKQVITHADTSTEALTISLNERGYVNIAYMAKLTHQTPDTVVSDLQGIIFRNPSTFDETCSYENYENADKYLSGNVRNKLALAKEYAKNDEVYNVNVAALKEVQPLDLEASDISVRLGTHWIPNEDYKDFIRETLQPSGGGGYLNLQYDHLLKQYKLIGQGIYNASFNATQAFGTNRMNAYRIIEHTLNMKTPQIFDRDSDGRSIKNHKETIAVQEKQSELKRLFKDWIFEAPDRRNRLVKQYNLQFNSTRLRVYNGNHLTFPGMNPDIELRPHQKNGVAMIIYGGNTLLAHEVGAGKSFVMCAAGVELMRLGIANKVLYVVPNHLVEQMGNEMMRLYPSANILLATKKDFQKKRRQRFVSKIATGQFDGIIIGHASFERVGISKARMEKLIHSQIDEVIYALESADGESWSIKQLERKRKTLEVQLEKLLDGPKDNQIDFESLGIDTLMVDEAHAYKNMFLATKMTNVSGVPSSASKKASDMYAKVQYINEVGGRVVFATGTPISNTLAEMYVMQKYLQSEKLKEYGLSSFDEWVSTFGSTNTALEVSPDGSGFRVKKRLSSFNNLPELMTMFKEVADIQTHESLNLPRPRLKTNKPIAITVPASETIKTMVADFGERAEKCRNKEVDPRDDNYLKITSEGRALAIDIRLLDKTAEDNPHSKVNVMVKNIFDIWQGTKADKLTQLVFCDLGTPTGTGFNLYQDIKDKLISYGIPPCDVSFIHDANTDKQKDDLFRDVRSGKVRVLIGSTQKMGTGTNCQRKMIALHELDVPWRASDVSQREGRILRQGNENGEVAIYRYATEGTFDAYSWNLVETKHKFFAQIMTCNTISRQVDNLDDTALSYAEIKALATGNPKIREKMEVDMEVMRLNVLKQQFTAKRYKLQDDIALHLPKRIAHGEERIERIQMDIAKRNRTNHQEFSILIKGKYYDRKADIADTMQTLVTTLPAKREPTSIGKYRDFEVLAERTMLYNQFNIIVRGEQDYRFDFGDSGMGNLQRLENCIDGFDERLSDAFERLDNAKGTLESSKQEYAKPFSRRDKLDELLNKQKELDRKLGLDKHDELEETPDDTISEHEIAR